VTLMVEDGSPASGDCASGSRTSTCRTWVTVVDGCEAVAELRLMVEQSYINCTLAQTLNRHLQEACRKFARGKCAAGVAQLEYFQDKLRHYAAGYRPSGRSQAAAKQGITPATAEPLIEAAQAIIDAYDPCDCMNP
jgi:hypothetical protein